MALDLTKFIKPKRVPDLALRAHLIKTIDGFKKMTHDEQMAELARQREELKKLDL